MEILLEGINRDLQAEFGALPDRPMERVKKADVETTESLVGWRAGIGLAEGLRKTSEWYREHFSDLEKYAALPVGSVEMRP